MALFNKKPDPEKEKVALARIVQELDRIYSNKSGDEYKMHGDITKSPVYNSIQRCIADLKSIKGFNKLDATDITTMFDKLHRPNFKKIVSDFIADKNNPDNIIMTAMFTVGYRLLVGELSRIYTSTEATESGFVYKPHKIFKKYDMRKVIRNFNTKVDSELVKNARSTTKNLKPGEKFKLESATMFQEAGPLGAIGSGFAAIINTIGPIVEKFGAWCKMIFPDVSELNPISVVSNMLSRSYDKKVSKFAEASAMYEETKNAYDEYMKQPKFRRDKKIEERYKKNIEKYNIKMQHAQAAIAHYDERSIKETMLQARKDDELASRSKSTSSIPSTSSTPSTPSEPDVDDTPKSSGGSDDNDPFDF